MVSVTEMVESVELPVDLRTADTGAVLFYLAGQVPLSVEDFSEDCRQNQSQVKDTLQSRFQNEVQIDQTEFITLTEAAWKPLLAEVNPILNRAKDVENRGKKYQDDANNEEAAKQYRTAAVLYSEVNKRLSTAGDVSDSLTQRLAKVSKTHDRMQKELAEDTVTHRKVLAQHREDEGDDAVQSDNYDEAARHFDDALLLYRGAKDAIETYNESCLLSSSEPLDSSEVDRLITAVKRKARNANAHAEETPETGDTEPSNETTEGESQTQGETNDEIQTDDVPNPDSTGENAESTPSRPSREDVIRAIEQYVDERGRIPTREDIANMSSGDKEPLLAHFDSWDSALETADIDKQQRLIDRLQEVAEDVGVPPSVGQVDEHGVYTSKVYIDEFGSWADTITTAGLRNISQDGPQVELSTEEAMVQRLQRLDEETEAFPMMSDVREKTDYDPQEYKSEFGSWNDALVAADIDKKERLLNEIRRVSDIVGSRPSIFELNTHSPLSMGEFTKSFQDIGEALNLALGDEEYTETLSGSDNPTEDKGKNSSKAGSVSDEDICAALDSLPRSTPTRQDYIEAIRLVAKSRDTVVKATDVSNQSPYSVNDITQEFGSWGTALEAAEVDNETRLLDELRRVADKVGHPPSTTEINEHGHVSAGMYHTHFGSYTEAREEALNDEHETEEEATPQTVSITTTVETIVEDSRLDKPIAVQVISTSSVDGNVKDARLRVKDIDGTQTWLNIWTKHNIEVSWETNHWYVLQNARGQHWTNSDGETGRNLSSTKDLTVKHFGTERPSVETMVR